MIKSNFNLAQRTILEINGYIENTGVALSLEDKVYINNPYTNDFVLKVNTKSSVHYFGLYVKRQMAGVSARSVLETIRRRSDTTNVLILADYISPDIVKYMMEHNISFINRAGKIFIHDDPLLLYLDYPDKEKQPRISGTAFEINGLKFIFHILNRPAEINRPYRHLAEEIKIAAGSISWIIRDLKSEGFVYVRNNNRFLRNREELLDKWWVAYGRKLRPKLLIGRYRVLDRPQTINLPEGCWWSGEVAAELMNQNLRSENQIIYTSIDPLELIKTLRLIPDEKGNLEILSSFWSNETDYHHQGQLVPEILVYADLMLSQNDRNVEIANELLKR